MDCTSDRNDKGGGELLTHEMRKIIRQNSLHLGKLVLCGSPFCSFSPTRRTKRTLQTKASICILLKAVLKQWMSQSSKRKTSPPTERLLTFQPCPG